MHPPNYVLNQYQRMAVQTANPLRQVVALYQGAAHFLTQAKAAMGAGEIAAKGEAVNRALDIISYLRSILDFEQGGQIAPELERLYAYMTERILLASARLDPEPLDEVVALLAPLRESWEELSRQFDLEQAGQANQYAAPEAPTHQLVRTA